MRVKFGDLKKLMLENSSFIRENNIDEILENLKNELVVRGFDLNNLDLQFGETSFNFIGEEIVIRITFIRYSNYDFLTDYVKNSDSILKPNYEKKIGNTGATVLELKRLDTLGITDSDITDTYIKLRNDGYLPFDLKPDNFGRDVDGKVYLLDYGELIFIKNRPLYLQKLDLESHANRCFEYDNIYKRYLKRQEKKKTNTTQEKISFLTRLKNSLLNSKNKNDDIDSKKR